MVESIEWVKAIGFQGQKEQNGTQQVLCSLYTLDYPDLLWIPVAEEH